jgi:hypothetical protein
MRKNIYDIINNSEIDIEQEYIQLHEQFYKLEKMEITNGNGYFNSVYTIASENFLSFSCSVRKRSGSIIAYNRYYKFDFEEDIKDITLDRLISFCEYILTICTQIGETIFCNVETDEFLSLICDNAITCMDLCGYKVIEKDKLYCFIEKKKEALAVAEIVDDNLSYTVLEYNHHTMKGDLDRKKASLLSMANDIELQKTKLKGINKTLQQNLFAYLNNFIRHNSDNDKYISTLTNKELEEIYDDTYQMWLLAKLELDNIERKTRVSKVLNSLNK